MSTVHFTGFYNRKWQWGLNRGNYRGKPYTFALFWGPFYLALYREVA